MLPPSVEPGVAITAASGGINTSTSTVTKSSTTSQPTAMRPLTESSSPCASSARRSTTVLATESAKTEHEAGAEVPAPERRKAGAQRRRDGDLHDRAGQGDAAHGEQVLKREVQADAEHQQHHADLGELAAISTSAT